MLDSLDPWSPEPDIEDGCVMVLPTVNNTHSNNKANIISMPLEDVHFKEDFYNNLFDGLCLPKVPKRFLKDFDMRSSVYPVCVLKDLCKRMRRRGLLSVKEETFYKELTFYLKKFRLAKSLKKFFEEKIYSLIDPLCFDPVKMFGGPSEEDVNGGGDNSEGFFLTEIKHSLESKGDNRRKIFEVSADLYDVYTRWCLLVDETNADTDVLEPGTMTALKEDVSSLTILRWVFLDVNQKVQKCIILVREWVRLYRDWCGLDLIHPFKVSFSIDLTADIIDRRTSIEEIDRDIDTVKKSIKHELINDLPLNLIHRQTQINNVESLLTSRNLVNNQYECLLARRSELIGDLEKSVRTTLKYEDTSQEIHRLEGAIADKYGELRHLNHCIYTSQEDSTDPKGPQGKCNNLPQLPKKTSKRKETQLKTNLLEKQRLQLMPEEIDQNIFKMRRVLGPKVKTLLPLLEDVNPFQILKGSRRLQKEAFE